MACGATLKRTLDFDPLLSPASPKRRRCAPLSAPASAAASSSFAAASPQKYLRMEPSPFGEVSSRLTTGEGGGSAVPAAHRDVPWWWVCGAAAGGPRRGWRCWVRRAGGREGDWRGEGGRRRGDGWVGLAPRYSHFLPGCVAGSGWGRGRSLLGLAPSRRRHNRNGHLQQERGRRDGEEGGGQVELMRAVGRRKGIGGWGGDWRIGREPGKAGVGGTLVGEA